MGYNLPYHGWTITYLLTHSSVKPRLC